MYTRFDYMKTELMHGFAIYMHGQFITNLYIIKVRKDIFTCIHVLQQKTV
jgi:hypothetical protein